MKKAVTLTLEENIIKQGKEQGKAKHRNFSNYVEWLILQDANQMVLQKQKSAGQK